MFSMQRLQKKTKGVSSNLFALSQKFSFNLSDI